MLPELGDPGPGEGCRAVVCYADSTERKTGGGGVPWAGEIRRDATLGESQLSIEILLHQWSPLAGQISLLLLSSFLLKGVGPRKEVD